MQSSLLGSAFCSPHHASWSLSSVLVMLAQENSWSVRCTRILSLSATNTAMKLEILWSTEAQILNSREKIHLSRHKQEVFALLCCFTNWFKEVCECVESPMMGKMTFTAPKCPHPHPQNTGI